MTIAEAIHKFIAARVFDIELVASGSHKAIDGHFRSGPLAGRSVNVKWYGREESLLDLTPDCLPDDYLVMTGPRGTQAGGEDLRIPGDCLLFRELQIP